MKTQRTRSVALATRSLKLAKPPDLQAIVETVRQRAEDQGQILAREVREELVRADADPRLWKEVVREAGSSLERRGGHFHFVPMESPARQRQALLQRRIQTVVHDLVGEYRRVAAEHERREADRITFLQPVTLEMGEGQKHHAVTKDISGSGLRLLGSRDLLGQKACVTVPRPGGAVCRFVVRIVWTCRVGDDLYENGAVFLELLDVE